MPESNAAATASAGQKRSHHRPRGFSGGGRIAWCADPDPHIVEAWKEYVHEISRLMPKESLASMRKHMLDRCTRVAAAATNSFDLSFSRFGVMFFSDTAGSIATTIRDALARASCSL